MTTVNRKPSQVTGKKENPFSFLSPVTVYLSRKKMPRDFEQIRCQRCRAANPLGQELCDRCGTRLMLVVEPTSMRFEADAAAGGGEASALLLERVSVLENNLMRFADKLERTLDLMLKQAQNAHTTHLLVETLIDALAELKTLDRAVLARHWREKTERDKEGRALATAEHPREKILEAYKGKKVQRESFDKLVAAGFEKIELGDAAGGVRSLERASLLSPRNFPLLAFLGEHFFRVREAELATRYLGEAFVARGGDARTAVLLGIVLADGGERVETAREMIAGAAAHGINTFAVHYALGRIAAAGGDWPAAADEFKKALAARPCAESHYAVAFAHYMRGRLRLALGHAIKALKLDESYAAVYQLLGLIRRAAGEDERAEEAFARASALSGAEGKRVRKGRAAGASDELLLHGFFGASRQTGRGLLTGGDERLARLLRDDALSVAAAAR
jgi:Flp pilus assembly protein TadD/ribosomal protein L40E